jgi:RNA ligase (TIGR02306 family)
MRTSTHRVEVVPFEMVKHPNADTLSIARVYGYTYVARTEDWLGVSRAAYVPPDNVVDVTRPEFSWLAPLSGDGRTHRVKAKKLRGVVSYGLMVPVPGDTPLGEDWTDRLGVVPYEVASPGGEATSGPPIYYEKYDLESLKRYPDLIPLGHAVLVQEKLDGRNARYCCVDGEMHAGSRTEWKRKEAEGGRTPIEWAVLRRQPEIEAFCRAFPRRVLYGEIYGSCGTIKYGFDDRFAAFDVLDDGSWWEPDRLSNSPVATPPLLASMPYNFRDVDALAEGKSDVSGVKWGTIREGVVVRPVPSFSDREVGRVVLKSVSPTYLEKY